MATDIELLEQILKNQLAMIDQITCMPWATEGSKLYRNVAQSHRMLGDIQAADACDIVAESWEREEEK